MHHFKNVQFHFQDGCNCKITKITANSNILSRLVVQVSSINNQEKNLKQITEEI